MEDGQQQVLHIHRLGVLDAGFEHGQLQNVAGPVVEHELAGVGRSFLLVLAHACLKLLFDMLNVEFQSAEEVGHDPVFFSEDAEQQVFRPHKAVGQACRLFPAESENL